jgi:Holliday junction resolvase RusA-like endonuclease
VSDFVVSEWYDYGVGRVEVVSARDPISLQASAARKARLREDLATVVAVGTTSVFTGDVEVTIEWFISQQVRYGTHMVADLDNIVKPLLDAVTGPDGVMIDDNQVQSLRVSWLDPGHPRVRFRLTLEALSPDEYRPRGKLFFVEFSSGRCFPFLVGESHQAVGLIVHAMDEALQRRQELIVSGIAEQEADGLLPVHRFFPRSRLGRFVVRPSADFL